MLIRIIIVNIIDIYLFLLFLVICLFFVCLKLNIDLEFVYSNNLSLLNLKFKILIRL